MKTINATSGYDIKYKALSKEDSDQIGKDIDTILARSLESVDKNLMKGIAVAVSDAIADLTCNPWSEWIKENGSDYEFFNTLCNGIFKALCSNSPKVLSEYQIKDLMTAWREQFPNELAEVCDAELVKENQKLREQYEFQQRVNSRGY